VPTLRVVKLAPGDRATLESLLRARTLPQRIVERVRIVLASADGLSNQQIRAKLDVSHPTVTLWLNRYEQEGITALLEDRPRAGRPREISVEDEEAIIHRTLHTRPPDGGQWSTRLMANATGLHSVTISRIWRSHGIRPHRVKKFKVSTDPHFLEKLRSVVGLYLNPPERAVVLSIDEKSQIQALDRTQPGLPLKKGRAGTITHDYLRHGTTTLFAALDVKTGQVVHNCMPRHRTAEFLRFMRRVVRAVPDELDIYCIVDNASTHKSPEVRAWLERNPRVYFHYVPTSSSWLNQVERLFSELTQRKLKHLAVNSVDELIAAIHDYLDLRNQNPKPFAWTATVQHILDKVTRAKETLAALH